jgi:hypothetical protein
MWCPDRYALSAISLFYPRSKLSFSWFPSLTLRFNQNQDIIASSGDYLRIWEVTPNGVNARALLNNVWWRLRI